MISLESIIASSRKPAQSRANHYMARVEEHLKGLPASEQLPFLKAELSKWMDRYSAWALRVDSGTASEHDLSQTAFDYTETLAALRGRINAA